MNPAVFLPRGGTAPQVAFGFVASQNRLHLPEQAGADPPQPHRNVLVDRGFAASERPRRRPHRGRTRPAASHAAPDHPSYVDPSRLK